MSAIADVEALGAALLRLADGADGTSERQLVRRISSCLAVALRASAKGKESVALAMRLAAALEAALTMCVAKEAETEAMVESLAAQLEEYVQEPSARRAGVEQEGSSADPDVAAEALRRTVIEQGDAVNRLLQQESEVLSVELLKRLTDRRRAEQTPGWRRALWWLVVPALPVATSFGANLLLQSEGAKAWLTGGAPS